jgi:hypothetical protein
MASPEGLPAGGTRMNSEVRKAYSDFLQKFNWDAFYTITCRKPRKDNLAFIRDIRDTLFAGNEATRSFVAIEPHKTGMIHAHGLVHWQDGVNLDKPLLVQYYNEKSRKLFGYSRFAESRGAMNTAMYCSKYVTKETNGGYEYDFLGEDWKTIDR